MPKRRTKTPDILLNSETNAPDFLTPAERERVENAHLGLGDVSLIPTKNIFVPSSIEELENPALHVLKLLRDPVNFAYTCKTIFNVEASPMQIVILRELWTKPFPMLIGSRGLSKSFCLGLYCLMRALFCQGSKIVIIGAAFRTSKVVFDYCETIWRNAPIFRDIIGNDGVPRRENDRCSMRIGESTIIALPLGTGEKIRGQRASILISEEFACLDRNTLVETDRGLIRIGETNEQPDGFRLLQPDGNTPIKPDTFIKTPPCEAYKVVTRSGYEFTCSAIHKVMTTKGWKLAKELTTSDYLIHESSPNFPESYVTRDGITVDEKCAWLFGLLISEGSVAGRHQMSIKNTSKRTLNKAKAILEKLTSHKVGICEKKAYTDKRGWKCKKSYDLYCCDTPLRNIFESLGLARAKAGSKKIPWSILQSPRSVVIAFLSGLYDGDGSAFLWSDKGKHNKLGISYYSVCKQLVSEVQVLCHKLGSESSIQVRTNHISDNPQYMLRMNGVHAHNLANLLDVPRWKKVIKNACKPHRRPNGVIWCKYHKKWLATVTHNGKLKRIGGYNTKEEADTAKAAYRHKRHLRVKSVTKLDGLHILFDYHVPGSNTFLANCFVQHNSTPRAIFENVVSGFAAVSLSPVEKMKAVARLKELKIMGYAEDTEELPTVPGLNSNQLIISGTAYYRFNHFFKEWEKYKKIIESKGDKDKLEDIFHGEIPKRFNWKDYSIIRIPVELIPEGFMDEKNISRARMTYHKTQFLMEMSAVFPKDSDGFYKRSLIETCVVGSYNNPICLPSCGSTPIDFSAVLQGEKDKKYVIAVDPASERDNCSIVILEVWPDHRRIIYCWTTTRKRHKARLAKHLVHEHDFFRYVAKTIRTLMKAFPCIRLAIDKMGGGISIMEALCDPATCTEGELPILPIIVRDDPKPTDRIPGLHIIEEIKFASSDWVIAANNGLKFDLESKSVLFPSFDAASLALAIESDKMEGRVIQNEDGTEEILYDTLEDCVINIEELKDELASIVHTQTDKAGRDHWDTPNSTEIDGKKTKTKKDRYSALLMANASARIMTHVEPTPQYYSTGGFAQDLVRKGIQEQPRGHFNPPWYTNVVSKGSPGFIVTRR